MTSLSERIEAVLAEHEDVSFDLTTPRLYTKHGGWNRSCACGHPLPDGGADDEVFYAAHRAHVAAVLTALLAPADAPRDEPGLAERQAALAAAWFAGYDKGNLDGYFGTSDERSKSPYADLDPYDEHGNLRALLGGDA